MTFEIIDNPYKKIGSVVEQWCKDHVYAQMIVTVSIGYDWEPPHEETHLLDFDAEKGELVWDSDWWEGQQHVELVGFTPLYKVRLKGEGEYARTVRHGRWVPDYDYTEYDVDGSTLLSKPLKFQDGWQCSLCGQYMTSKTNYCPNCGCRMDLEVDNG